MLINYIELVKSKKKGIILVSGRMMVQDKLLVLKSLSIYIYDHYPSLKDRH